MKKKNDLPSLFWRDVKGYEGHYQVSVDGEAKNVKTGRILKPAKTKGYLRVHLCKDGKGKMHQVHRLVAQAFIPNPDNLPCVNHKDENPLNNKVENLEWCTQKYNINWGTRNERVAQKMRGVPKPHMIGVLKNRKDQSKPVVALDKQGRIVHVFPSAQEAGRSGYNWSTVGKCCRGDKGCKTHKGLFWYYQDDFLKKTS